MPIRVEDETNVPLPSPTIQADEGEQTFQSFADSLPETAKGFLESAQQTIPDNSTATSLLDDAIATEASEDSRTKTVKMSRKMKKAMDKLKVKAASLPIMWFHQQAKANPEWELDEEEKELLSDAIGTVFELLDINVEIQPLEWTLRSMWWVIGYPILAFTFLFLTKKSMVIDRENTERLGDVQ